MNGQHPGQVPAPRHPDRLLQSRWTRECDRDGHRHFVVDAVTNTGSSREVTLRSVIDPDESFNIPWRVLRNRTLWSPGWRSLQNDDVTDDDAPRAA